MVINNDTNRILKLINQSSINPLSIVPNQFLMTNEIMSKKTHVSLFFSLSEWFYLN